MSTQTWAEHTTPEHTHEYELYVEERDGHIAVPFFATEPAIYGWACECGDVQEAHLADAVDRGWIKAKRFPV